MEPYFRVKAFFNRYVSWVIWTDTEINLCGDRSTVFFMRTTGTIFFIWSRPPLSALANATQLLIFAVYITVFMLIPMVAFDIIFQIRSHLKSYVWRAKKLKIWTKGDPQPKSVSVSNNTQCLKVEWWRMYQSWRYCYEPNTLCCCTAI